MGPTIFDGLLGYQRQQEALVMDRQHVQENSLAIAAKTADFQSQKAENEAIRQFDPNNLDSLQQVAGTLAKSGNAKAALDVMKEYSDIKAQQQLAQQRNVNGKMEQFKNAGGILSNMTQSQDAYNKGIMSLSAMGINPMAIGLSGNYDTDKGALPGMAKSTMSTYQQMEIQQRTSTEDRMIQQEADRLEQQAKQNSIENKRLDFAEARSNREENAQAERAKMDTLKQNKADAQLKSKQLQLSRPLKAQAEDVLNEISLDDRVKDAPDPVKKILAARIASRTSAALAKRVDPDYPEAEYQPESYIDEAKKQLDLMEKNGEWSPYKSHIIGRNEGGFKKQVEQTQKAKQDASGKVAAPAPKTIDPKSLPVGGMVPMANGKKLKVIGKDAKGNPLFESDANGNPVLY
jgi:hypothetical protein